MKNPIWMLVVCLALLDTAHSQQQNPALWVHAGETQTLPPQTYIYSSVEIDSGGTLQVASNSAAWTMIYSKGNFTIKGTITARNFKSGPNTYSTVSPDGEQLSHTYSETNQGGAGGHGGISACTYNGGGGNVFAYGGRGALGVQAYGGGGGAGGVYTGRLHCQDQPVKGIDASGVSGGAQQSGQEASARGGDGAARGPYVNGGLLYLYCGGSFDGEGGTIDASGNNGPNGANGQNNPMNPSLFGGGGGGGGGGGAPGGEGGVVIIKVKGSSGLYPSFLVNGGNGGLGGKGGTGFANYSTVPPSAGEDGQAGVAGQNGQVKVEH